MKKDTSPKRQTAKMLDEYDFRRGTRGKYAARYAAGTNVVVLDADVAVFFPDARSVNQALRALSQVAARARRTRREKVSQHRLVGESKGRS